MPDPRPKFRQSFQHAEFDSEKSDYRQIHVICRDRHAVELFCRDSDRDDLAFRSRQALIINDTDFPIDRISDLTRR